VRGTHFGPHRRLGGGEAPGDDGGGSGGGAPMRGCLGLEIGSRRSGGEAVGGGDAKALFYRVGGGAGQLGDRGERAAAVVRHDGG
jgi:hypothetical protein